MKAISDIIIIINLIFQLAVQRSLSAKNLSHAKGGILLAAYLKILPWFFFLVPGMVSRVLYPGKYK